MGWWDGKKKQIAWSPSSSLVLQLNGEAFRQFLPEADHVHPDESVDGSRAEFVLGVALLGRFEARALLVGPDVGEESLERRMIVLLGFGRFRFTAPLEKAPQQIGQRLIGIRLLAGVAGELPAAVEAVDLHESEVSLQPRQQRPVVRLKLVVGRLSVVAAGGFGGSDVGG